MTQQRNFNNLKEWLEPLIEERGMSVEKLAMEADISRAAIYAWMSDKRRPTEEVMVVICRVLDVPLEEGLKQYTPNRNGRPTGSRDNTTRGLSARR